MHVALSPRLLGSLALLLIGCPGCGTFGSRAELEDCRKRTQVLQAESNQFKDQTIALRSQNRDLAKRSVDDDKRIRELETTNDRLVASVTGYQRERDALSASLDQLKYQVQAAADSSTKTALRDSAEGSTPSTKRGAIGDPGATGDPTGTTPRS